MPKRYTDTDVWTRQRWFRKLSKDYKLAFFYIKDLCDTIGVWKIDCADLMDATGVEDFDLTDFVAECNVEYDKITGKKSFKERLKIISEKELWITGFVQFQYENKDTGKINIHHIIAESALQKLWLKGLYNEAIKMKYLFVNEPFTYGGKRTGANGNQRQPTAADGGGVKE